MCMCQPIENEILTEDAVLLFRAGDGRDRKVVRESGYPRHTKVSAFARRGAMAIPYFTVFKTLKALFWPRESKLWSPPLLASALSQNQNAALIIDH